MLRIVNLEEIEGMLLRIPELIDRLEQRAPEFTPQAKRWLTTLETVLGNNHLPAAGHVASLRGLLISAEQGVVPDGLQFSGRPNARRIRDAAAANALRAAADLVSNVINEDRARVAEADSLCRQLIALARRKGLIPVATEGGDHTARLKTAWSVLAADSDIARGTVRIEGLVGPSDALIVLDRAISA